MDNKVITTVDENPEFNRFAVPVKWGLLIGVFSILFTTINFLYLANNFMLFMGMNAILFIGTIIFYGVAGAQQRKALGGYIDIKQAFQAIFVTILVSSILTTIYGIIYSKFIDPGVMDRIKESTLNFMASAKAPQEKLDETAKTFDEQVADSMKPGRLLYAFAKSLVIQSIFGFICAAIVKRQKPLVG